MTYRCARLCKDNSFCRQHVTHTHDCVNHIPVYVYIVDTCWTNSMWKMALMCMRPCSPSSSSLRHCRDKSKSLCRPPHRHPGGDEQTPLLQKAEIQNLWQWRKMAHTCITIIITDIVNCKVVVSFNPVINALCKLCKCCIMKTPDCIT